MTEQPAHDVPQRPLVVTGWGDRRPQTEADAIAHALERLRSSHPVVLSVVDGVAPTSTVELPAEVLTSLGDRLKDAHSERLDTVVSKMPGSATPTVALGPTVPIVLTAIEEGNHDVVVVLNDGSPGTMRVVERLIEDCPVPVLVEPEALQGGGGANVVVAIDPTGSVARNRQLLVEAAALARRRAAELHVVQAWRLLGEQELLGASSAVGVRDLAGFGSAIEQSHREALEALLIEAGLSSPDDLRVVRHLVEGSATLAIDRIVGLNRVGLVVTASQGRPSVEHALAGSQSLSVASSRSHATLILTPAFTA